MEDHALIRFARRAAFALGLLLVVAVAVARLADVVDHGVLLPFFEEYEVAQVSLLGVELYVDTSSGLSDAISVCALALIAVLLLAGARAIGDDAALRRTFVTAGLGSAYLAADDLLAIHETVGHNLGALAALPVIDHPDDLIVGLYGLAVLAFGWRHRALLTGPARRLALVAAISGGGAVLHDLTALHLRMLEEILEVVAAGALVAAVAVVVRTQVAARRGLPAVRLARDPAVSFRP